MLVNLLPKHGITSNPPRQSTAASLLSAPRSTRSMYSPCTKLLRQVLHQPVMLLSKLSSVQGQTDLLYWCLEVTNLLTGYSVYHLASSSVKSYWWVHIRQNVSKKSYKLISWHSRPIDRSEPISLPVNLQMTMYNRLIISFYVVYGVCPSSYLDKFVTLFSWRVFLRLSWIG